eukprot:g2650.t1
MGWGDLTAAQQASWRKYACDTHAASLRKARAHHHERDTVVSFKNFKNMFAEERQFKGNGGHQLNAQRACGSRFPRGPNRACCNMYHNNPSMVIGKLWGDLPQQAQKTWAKNQCDKLSGVL